jgi:prepilin-type N-terminal cleavage/methylation domain-containing protein
VSRRPGFTLLEMLVAMTLLAFIMVAGQQAIALAARAAAPRGDGGHAFLLRHQISDWLEESLPIRTDRRDRSPLVFAGEPAALRFVTVLPQRFGVAGPHVMTLSRASDGLLASWRPLRLSGDPPPAGERLLVEGADRVAFRYWDSAGGWRETWPAGQRLPDLIELSVDGGPAEGWQPILVTLRNR